MPYAILNKQILNDSVELMEIKAPMVTRNCQPGQFIILRVDEEGERIPLTIADYDREKESVTIIYQTVGYSTKLLAQKEAGDFVHDFAGPLGEPTKLHAHKRVLGIGGGVGIAPLFPQMRAFKELGAEVDIILGGRSEDLIILSDWFEAFSNHIYYATNDGSKGTQGFVTDVLSELLEKGEKYDEIVAIGPLVMMKAVAQVSLPKEIKTSVSVNPIMVDGTGMCGGCRLTVGGEVKFACVDGPDFDAAEIDFDELIQRQGIYREHEEEHDCKIGLERSYDFNKSKTKVPMPVLPAEERIFHFDEVATGYTPEMAIEEARRCVLCKDPKCMEGCPVNVNIPGFIEQVAQGNFLDAYRILTSENSLPAICGRVCPQEDQCEKTCLKAKRGEPVGIGRLERFVADYFIEHGDEDIPPSDSNGRKVAVVGAGPAGIACAGDLAKLGYDVTIYEALHAAGGVLMYGIPEFRLPKAIVKKELDIVKKLGVKIETNVIVGRSATIENLKEDGFEAVFIGSGAGLPRFMGIPNESLNGVYAANEFLTRVNLMKAHENDAATPVKRSDRVAVIGGGNVAMDAARTAKRLGAKEVFIVYRRGERELPAREEEIHHAKEEGIVFRFLTNPIRILGEEGCVTGLECVRMELGEPDDSGRRRPATVKDSEFVLEVGKVIMAIGQTPNPLIKQATPELDTNRWGGIVVEEQSLETSIENVYAGGDVVSGAATVILAMGAGRSAAKSIHERLRAD